MLRVNKRIFPIDEQPDTKGSIVLEASLVMPLFVMVIFLFIYMVQMTLISTQMQVVAANAVRQVSAHIYPVALAVSKTTAGEKTNRNEGEPLPGKQSAGWRMPELSLSAWANEYASKLPEPLSGWVQSAANRGDEPLQDVKSRLSEQVLDPAIKPMLRPFLKGTWLKEERLHVHRVTVPDLKTGRNPYFGLEISYELPIKVPLTGRRILLQARAEERLWIGDTGEQDGQGKGSGEGESGKGKPASIVSKPEPAYAGHRALVKALVEPGTQAKLTVYYKSGVSKAKYLGAASAGKDGIVEWEWLVGGNTTPGTWTIEIETEDGLRTTEQFNVESP
ncbi:MULTISPECIES: TadE family protein [Paenibacillus]|uniref:TadE/TadG family type IV pilus assembly protein n=1 Tax=Paenibacillus TaxID=44249 RepID=UPI002FE26DE4